MFFNVSSFTNHLRFVMSRITINLLQQINSEDATFSTQTVRLYGSEEAQQKAKDAINLIVNDPPPNTGFGSRSNQGKTYL